MYPMYLLTPSFHRHKLRKRRSGRGAPGLHCALVALVRPSHTVISAHRSNMVGGILPCCCCRIRSSASGTNVAAPPRYGVLHLIDCLYSHAFRKPVVCCNIRNNVYFFPRDGSFFLVASQLSGSAARDCCSRLLFGCVVAR